MTAPGARLIDRWFPVAAVDEACGTTAGSGLAEKAVFTWFASRPIAQARAAALTVLLPDDLSLKPLIETAVREGDSRVLGRLSDAVRAGSGGKPPVVLDMFSGRGIIPLEAARAGASATGIDLSPVATLAGRLLADYPARDWSAEPPLPFGPASGGPLGFDQKHSGARLPQDVEIVLAEIGRRVAERMAPHYPPNGNGEFPWGYLWAITVPCDGCKRPFPLLGSLVLRHPHKKTHDAGQALRLITSGDRWSVEVVVGKPSQQPTYSAGFKADGKKRKGKTARCPFCGHIHPLEAIKAKGSAHQYEDALIAVADLDDKGDRFFRLPTKAEAEALTSISLDASVNWPYSAVPDEVIAAGNVHTVMASGYGYRTFGELWCPRQLLCFIRTIEALREVHDEAVAAGLSSEYGKALASYAAANFCRRLRYTSRGCRLRTRGDESGDPPNYLEAGDIFTNQASINFQFDYLEVGPGLGGGTWASVSGSSVQAIRRLVSITASRPARLRRASATALPLRDGSVDAVITDPPYYDMVEYADASDVFQVWLKRALFDIEPDLFGPEVQQPDGLQDKNQEIIVRRVHEPSRVRHDTEFYETMLAKSFAEARRVLKPDGHLVVVFGHSDPDAWRRLLGALQTAGFVVTSAWPSRSEGANTGVASIKVTVTIGCRVAPAQRPLGITSQVDREIADAVTDRVSQWDADGLALEDQLMASYGPAMEVYGRYSRVLNPDNTDADLDRYLNIARRTVRDAMRLRVDELPLETFDATTRFAVFWLRAKGRSEVPKGEARFFAQADELRLDELRGRILAESPGGFRLRLDEPAPVRPDSSTFEVVRAMAYAWNAGGTEAVANVIAAAEREANDQHLWAVVADLTRQIPSADMFAKALAGIKRMSNTVSTLVGGVREAAAQTSLFDERGAVR
jgi:putative DNA methylase